MKRSVILMIVMAVVVGGLFIFFQRSSAQADEIQYRYAPVTKGELIRSTSATGLIVAHTSVDVRSKAGGTIVKLHVDAGDFVKAGDILAEIDPRDTRAIYEQAEADLESANARIAGAQTTLELQRANSITAVADARVALQTARTRLERARIDQRRVPETTSAAIASAQASYQSAEEDLRRFDAVTEPQRRRETEGALSQAEAAFRAAEADLRRNRELLDKGYVSQAIVDRAVSTYEAARSAYNTARTRSQTLDRELRAERESLRLARDRAAAALREARAQGSLVATGERTVREAEQAVRLAEVNLQKAIDAQKNNELRLAELRTARSSAKRSRIAMQDARVQLESTVVVAPSDGVVTQKYAEVGTVIPPGVSQFSATANIVQLSDVTRLYVDCAVDEADYANIRVGQKVRIVAEAFPAARFEGVVRRINPAAVTNNSITAITVRVEVFQKKGGERLLPGMNATCEFITLSKPNIMIIPAQAVKREGEAAYVLVKTADPLKPERRKVEVGEAGNDGFEVVSGLKEGEEVVVAEINLRQIRETQRRMEEAQQGGGLAGGRPGAGGPRRTTTGGGGR